MATRALLARYSRGLPQVLAKKRSRVWRVCSKRFGKCWQIWLVRSQHFGKFGKNFKLGCFIYKKDVLGIKRSSLPSPNSPKFTQYLPNWPAQVTKIWRVMHFGEFEYSPKICLALTKFAREKPLLK